MLNRFGFCIAMVLVVVYVYACFAVCRVVFRCINCSLLFCFACSLVFGNFDGFGGIGVNRNMCMRVVFLKSFFHIKLTKCFALTWPHKDVSPAFMTLIFRVIFIFIRSHYSLGYAFFIAFLSSFHFVSFFCYLFACVCVT